MPGSIAYRVKSKLPGLKTNVWTPVSQSLTSFPTHFQLFPRVLWPRHVGLLTIPEYAIGFLALALYSSSGALFIWLSFKALHTCVPEEAPIPLCGTMLSHLLLLDNVIYQIIHDTLNFPQLLMDRLFPPLFKNIYLFILKERERGRARIPGRLHAVRHKPWCRAWTYELWDHDPSWNQESDAQLTEPPRQGLRGYPFSFRVGFGNF